MKDINKIKQKKIDKLNHVNRINENGSMKKEFHAEYLSEMKDKTLTSTWKITGISPEGFLIQEQELRDYDSELKDLDSQMNQVLGIVESYVSKLKEMDKEIKAMRN